MNSSDWKSVIDLYYPADRKVRGILLTHSRAVAECALSLARRNNLGLDPAVVEAAAMLHDVGIIRTDAPGIDCHGNQPYLCHGPIGADMLRQAGVDEVIASVAERHTGAGLTSDEIAAAGLPLPKGRDYMPRSVLERLICYADCFYSKSPELERLAVPKPLERVKASMTRFGPGVEARFEALCREFGPVNG